MPSDNYTTYQTLNEFLTKPFGVGADSKKYEYDKKFNELSLKKAIYCENIVAAKDGTYMIHVVVPSESQEKMKYDVVIQFFPKDDEVAKSMSISQYYIQFYSNSPSFIYKYAALYRVSGYLIEALYDKTDPEYAHTLPEKSNPKMELGYDKSIYFACKFIQQNQYTILRKSGMRFYKMVSMKNFLRSISSYDDIKTDSEFYKLEKSIQTEVEKDRAAAKEKLKETGKAVIDKVNPVRPLKKIRESMKKAATRSTLKSSESSIKVIPKKKGKKSTGGSSVHVLKKKKASTTTKKR